MIKADEVVSGVACLGAWPTGRSRGARCDRALMEARVSFITEEQLTCGLMADRAFPVRPAGDVPLFIKDAVS